MKIYFLVYLLYNLFLYIFFRYFIKFIFIILKPLFKCFVFSLNGFSKFYYKIRDIFLKYYTKGFSKSFLIFTIRTVYMKEKCGMRGFVNNFYRSVKAYCPYLMCSAGRKAAGNMNFWKSFVFKVMFSYFFRKFFQKPLRIS